MKKEKRGRWWFYEISCETCGVKKMVRKDVINKNKNCRSCARTISQTKHGQAAGKNKKPSPLYVRWHKMRTRCNNPNFKNYRYYGGKGITICEEWNEFINFYNDMKDTFFDNATLDRIDPNKGYNKQNCRWLTRSDNTKHRHGTL